MLQCFYCICIVIPLCKTNFSSGTIKFLWSEFECTLRTWSLMYSQRPVLHFPHFKSRLTLQTQIKFVRCSAPHEWRFETLCLYNCVTSLGKKRSEKATLSTFFPSGPQKKTCLLKKMFVILNYAHHGRLFFFLIAAGQVTSWSRSSKNTGTSSTWVRHQHKKPSEVSWCGSLVQWLWHIQYTKMCLMKHSLCLAITSSQFCSTALLSVICCGFAELS